MPTPNIDRQPIAAFGNSDGNFQMLERMTAGDGTRFGLNVHHDDADREVAYDRKSAMGSSIAASMKVRSAAGQLSA